MDISEVLAEMQTIRTQQAKLAERWEELVEMLKSAGTSGPIKGKRGKRGRKAKRVFSKATRDKMAQAARDRWAARKAKEKKPSGGD